MRITRIPTLLTILLVSSLPHHTQPFWVPSHPRPSPLFSGYGTARDYTWKEEAFELEVSVQVPADTRAKDVQFTATSTSIDLRLGSQVLLDGRRKLRGRVQLDGTYWVISDPELGPGDHRQITVTIEKLIRTPRNDFDVIEYDWKGVFSNDTEDEISQVHYDEPEKLNVREYAASLGVDLDNMDMSKVDKTMFSSGLNLTQQAMDQLNEAGYIQEITQQADGSEYDADGTPRKPIPFLDTESPWQDTAPVQYDPETNQTYVKQTRNMTRAAFAKDSSNARSKSPMSDAADPIDTLTVKKLKEILKSQGLKTTGNKKELQDRLRAQVNSLLQGKSSSGDSQE